MPLQGTKNLLYYKQEVSEVNETMGQTDIQFKDELRKDLIKYEEFLELINEGDIDRLKRKITAEIERINASLQD